MPGFLPNFNDPRVKIAPLRAESAYVAVALPDVASAEAAHLNDFGCGAVSAECTVDGYGLVWVPSVETPVEGEDAEKLIELIDALEDLDDTRDVSVNADISDEEMARIAGD